MPVKLSRRDEKMVSKRARSEPLTEPPYDMELVPVANADSILSASCLVRVTDRELWRSQLTELLLLCNEAAWRSAQQQKTRRQGLPPPAAPPEAKPLVLEYILDRVDTDDPICGYQLRTRAEGWLQGFVTFTTFTTWQTYCRWDSLDVRCGITLDDLEAHVVDADGSLSSALDECDRFGDPDGCGVIWPRVAEITLLGGMGCGTELLQLALDHLASQGCYDFVVLQATDNAVPFYERHGFVRVGAVAVHYSEKDTSVGSEPPAKRKRSETRGGRPTPIKTAEAADIARRAVEQLDVPEKPVQTAVLANRTKSQGGEPMSVERLAEAERLWWANRAIHAFVKALMRRPSAPHFTEPVADILPLYRTAVKEPMDLSTMAAGACAGLYDGRLSAALADAKRIEIAAVTYNGKRPRDPIPREVVVHAAVLTKDATELAQAWQAAFPPWLFGVERLDDDDVTMSLPSAREQNRSPRTFAEAVASGPKPLEQRGVEAPNGLGNAPQSPYPRPQVTVRDPEFAAIASCNRDVLGYSHWTFSEQPTADQFPSYMMGRRLAPLSPGGGLPARSDRGETPRQDGAHRRSRVTDSLAELPRGVVPRGEKFVAKLVSPGGGAPEYFGPCDTAKEASAWYSHAASQLRKKEKAQANGAGARPATSPTRSRSRTRPRLWELLPELLVETAPRIVPAKAFDLEREGRTPGAHPGGTVMSPPVENPVGSVIATVALSEPKRLYDAVVTVDSLPQPYARFRYWFVMQFVPDMQWCGLTRVAADGSRALYPVRESARMIRFVLD